MTPSPRNKLAHALFVLNFLRLDNDGRSAADRHWHSGSKHSHATVIWKDPLTSQWEGPDPVLIWGHGSACIYDQKNSEPRWLPERRIKQVNPLSRVEHSSPSETHSPLTDAATLPDPDAPEDPTMAGCTGDNNSTAP